jgi:hypothetical protein
VEGVGVLCFALELGFATVCLIVRCGVRGDAGDWLVGSESVLTLTAAEFPFVGYICQGDALLDGDEVATGAIELLFVPCCCCCFLRSFCDGLNDPDVFRSLAGAAESPSEMLDVRVEEACAMISCSPSFDEGKGVAPQGRTGNDGLSEA